MHLTYLPSEVGSQRSSAVGSESEDAGFRVVFDESATSLGMSFKTMPPGHLEVTKVHEGQWAEKKGVKRGHVLVEVNGEDLDGMSKEAFKTHIEDRPLSMYFERGSRKNSQRQSMSRSSVLARAAARRSGSIQDPDSVRRASELRTRRSGSLTVVPRVDEEEQHTKTRTKPSRKVRGLGKSLGKIMRLPGRIKEPPEPGNGFNFTAGPEVKSLGIAFNTWPPGYPQIKKVTEGSWAEDMKIEAGFYVYEANGKDLLYMSKDTFMGHLKVRPLTLYVEPPTPSQSEEEEKGEDDAEQESEPVAKPPAPRKSSLLKRDRGSRGSVIQERKARASSANEATAAPLSSPTETLRTRKSRKSTLLDAVELERKRKEYDVMHRTLRQEEDAVKKTKIDVKSLRSELKTEIAACEQNAPRESLKNRASYQSSMNPRLQLAQLLQETHELEAEYDKIAMAENTEVATLRSQYDTAKAMVRRRSSTVRGEAHALVVQVEDLRENLKSEHAASSAEKEKVRSLWKKAPPAAQAVEVEEETQVREMQALHRAEELAARGAQRRVISAGQSSEQEVHSEFADEIADLKMTLRGEQAAIRGIKRTANERLAEAASQISRSDGGLIRATEAALRGLERTEDSIRMSMYSLGDALDAEIAAIETDRAEQLSAESNLESGLAQMEVRSSSLLQNARVLEYVVATNQFRHACSIESELEDRKKMLQDEEAAVKDLVVQLEIDVDKSKIGGVRRNLQYATEERDRVKKTCIDEEQLAKAKLALCTQATHNINELRAALKKECVQGGRALQEWMNLEQSASSLNREFNSAHHKMTREESEVDQLKRRLVQEQIKTRKQEAASVAGTFGKAELEVYQSTFGKQEAALQRQAKAKEASRIADKAEMAALRSALMHEEAELYHYSRTQDKRQKGYYDASMNLVEISSLKSALARERAGLAHFSAANLDYVELESHAKTEIVESSEVIRLQAVLRQQESEILKLQYLANESNEPRLVAHFGSPAPTKEIENLTNTAVKARAIESQIEKQKSQAAKLRQECAAVESEALSGRSLRTEVISLKRAVDEQQKQLRDMHNALQVGASTPGRTKEAAELVALRSALTAESAEAEILRDRHRVTSPRPRAGDSAETVALRTLIMSEEAQCRLLRQRLLYEPKSPLRTVDSSERNELMSLQSALTKEKCLALELAQELSAARSRHDAAEISQLRYALAEVQVRTDSPRSAIPTPGSPSLFTHGRDYPMWVGTDGAAQLGMLRLGASPAHPTFPPIGGVSMQPSLGGFGGLSLRPPPYDAVFSGSDIVEMSREVEAAELNELHDRVLESEKVANKAVGDQISEAMAYKKLKQSYGIQGAELHELMRYPASENLLASAAQAANAADLASARVLLVRLETDVTNLELRLGSFETPDFINVSAFKTASQDKENHQLLLRDEVRNVQTKIVQEEADKNRLYEILGTEEASIAATSHSIKMSYQQELHHVREAITWEEDEIIMGLKRKRVEAIAATRKATMAEEERAIRMLMQDNADKVASNLGEVQEAGQLQAQLLQERLAVERLEEDLARTEMLRNLAEHSVVRANELHQEKLSNLQRSVKQAHQSSREMAVMAADRGGIVSREAIELDQMRAAQFREKEMVADCRDRHADTELKISTAIAAEGVQKMELDSLRAKLSKEMKDANFGNRELSEISNLRSTLSAERSAVSVLRLDKADAEAQKSGLELTYESEEMSLEAALMRAHARSGETSENASDRVEEMAWLELALRREEDVVKQIAEEADKGDARVWAAENSLRDLELREAAVIKNEMHRSARLADVRELTAVAGARIIEEQAAEWCEEAGTVLSHLTEAQLQDKLDNAEREAKELRFYFSAADEYASEAGELRRQVANETFTAQTSFTDLHKIRAAEGRMLQDAMAEVWEATSRNSVAIRHRDDMKANMERTRQIVEQYAIDLDSVKIMLTTQASRAPWDAAPRSNSPLRSMIQDARGVLTDKQDPPQMLQSGVYALAQGPVTPRAYPTTPLGIPMEAIASPGGTSAAGPMLAPLGSHASSLRMEAEGIRTEMSRFQARRAQSGYN